MSDGKKYYCFCGSNCKYETMTKEQILTAIAQAVETGKVQNVDAGFITKVKENNLGGFVTFWCGTQAQYNALPAIEKNCLYIITDETTAADLEKTVRDMDSRVKVVERRLLTAEADGQDAMMLLRHIVNGGLATDISSNVVFNIVNGNSGLTGVEEHHKHVYVQSLGIVFYSINLLIKGTLAEGTSVELIQNKYKADDSGSSNFVAASNHPAFIGEYFGGVFNVRTNEAFSQTDTWRTIVFNGWYFCKGE